MRNLKQKFIITENGIKIGRRVFHKEFRVDDSEVIGGGSWYWDIEEDTLYLYGESHDFGAVNKDDIVNNMKDIKKRYFKNSKVVFEEDCKRGLFNILNDTMSPKRAMLLISKNDFI